MSTSRRPLRLPNMVGLKTAIERRLEKVKHVIVIMSGKGGVGKSFVASNLAVALASLKFKVGVFDADFHGPSTPRMLGIRGIKPRITGNGIEPVEGPLGVKVFSLGLILPDSSTPVIWRGPLKSSAILQYAGNITWGELDFLVIDMPPGTGDEALTVAQNMPPPDGVVFVTTPSALAVEVVSRSIVFAAKLGIRPLGIIENMSSFYCPKCGTLHKLMGAGYGRALAKSFNIEFLGEIPIDPRVAEAGDRGQPIVIAFPGSEVARRLMEVAVKIVEAVEHREDDESKELKR